MVAVPVGVLRTRKILLVVVLGVVERAGWLDLRGDVAHPGRPYGGLEGVARYGRRGELRVGRGVDGRPVLGTDVVALAHALGRVVVLPEHLQQVLIGHLRRVVHDLDGLGVPGPTGAGLLVRRVLGEPALVADGGGVHAGDLPEHPLRSPEAPHAEVRHLEAGRPGSAQRGPQHGVPVGQGHLVRAPNERLVDGDHVGLLRAQKHAQSILLPRHRDHYRPGTRDNKIRTFVRRYSESAWSRSDSRSSTVSMPTDSRTRSPGTSSGEPAALA